MCLCRAISISGRLTGLRSCHKAALKADRDTGARHYTRDATQMRYYELCENHFRRDGQAFFTGGVRHILERASCFYSYPSDTLWNGVFYFGQILVIHLICQYGLLKSLALNWNKPGLSLDPCEFICVYVKILNRSPSADMLYSSVTITTMSFLVPNLQFL